MRTKQTLGIVLTIILLANSNIAVPQVAELASIGAGLTVGEALDNLDDLVRSRIDQAIDGADYLLEKALRETHLLVQNLQFIYRDELNHTLKAISAERRQVFYDVQDLIEQGSIEGQKFETQTVLDLQRLIAELPFTNDEYWIQGIHGSFLAHKEGGPYLVILEGSGFDAGRTTKVWLDGQELTNITSSERRFVRVEIPRSQLHSHFAATEVKRLPFRFETTKIVDPPLWKKIITLSLAKPKAETLYQYEGFIGLLPEKPASYELIVFEEKQVWSDELFVSAAPRTNIPGAGPDVQGENPSHRRQICVTLPLGCKIERGTEVRGCNENGWGQFEGTYVYSNDDRTVCISHKSWFENEKRCWIKVNYRRLVSQTNRQLVDLSKIGSKSIEEHLSLDVPYTTALPSTTVRYELVTTLFNGEVIRCASDFTDPRVLVRVSTVGAEQRITATLLKEQIYGI